MTQNRYLKKAGHALFWRWQHLVGRIENETPKIQNWLRWHIRNKGKRHTLPGELIVSLTSYRPRFVTLAATLKSLITQSVAPDRIIIWIGHSDEAYLPKDVRDLEKFGVNIRTTQDVGPYTKIVPALEAFPNAYIITVDDDIFYQNDLIQALVANYRDDRTVVCHRAHEIIFEDDGSIKPYPQWRHEVAEQAISEIFLATGVGGVLYPPNCLPAETVNRDLFLSVCPGADDIWLYWMGRRNGLVYKTVGGKPNLKHWGGSQDAGLFNENWSRGNDAKIKSMIKQFGYPGPFSYPSEPHPAKAI